MSSDDVTAYMAKRERSTLIAPNPEGSPIHAVGLLNPTTGGGGGAMSNLGVGLSRSPPTSVPATPQHYFQKTTPQGSLSHMPAPLLSGNTTTSAASFSAASGNNNGAGSASAARAESPSSSHNTPSSHLRHISDVARMVVRNQHAAFADPTSVANNQLAANNVVDASMMMTVGPKKEFNYETGDTGLINFLCSVPHLYMISNADIRELSRCILRREYNLHDTILVNKQSVSHVYIVLKGRVEAYSVSQLQWDPRSQRPEDMVTHHERIGTIEVANMFCIDSVVFSEPSEFMYCAGDEKTLLGLIPASLFLSILNRNVAMRQSIGRKIADHMDIFICFKDFCRHIFSHETAKHEYLPLWQILHAYERLDNCIHTKRASQELDTDAWNYALKRLPENLTTTFVFDLVRALPPFLTTRMKDLAKAGGNTTGGIGDVKYIVTKERRRCSWQLGMEGKTLVLLRDGFTDLLDFITCLCIHIIESNKLRGRLQGMVSPPAVDILDAKLSAITKRCEAAAAAAACAADAAEGATEEGDAKVEGDANKDKAEGDKDKDKEKEKDAKKETAVTAAVAAAAIEGKDIREVLSKMPLSERERSGLHRNWGDSCLKNIYAVLMHREEYLLRVDVSASRQFMTDPFHEWSLNLRKKLMLAMRLNPQGYLPEDLIIDIISSNTHSTKSLLSSFARVHRDKILAHAKEKKPELFNLPWAVQEDLVYANTRNYTDATGTGKEFNEALKKAGFEILEDTAMTGMQVDIVPVNQLDMSLIDPLLATRNCVAAGPRHFILNMDFAFGAQADGITATLVDTFGKHIRSFNVMGKAGGIASSMRRGDIQLASHVLLSKSSLTTEDYLDELRSCGNLDITTDFVQNLCGQQSKIQVFNGPVLTIPGTMLQNDKLLLYYRHIWHCVGVEMEGSYFARQIKENIKAKLLSDTIQTRFAYYTSDMPLHSLQGDASLSTPMRPNEGTPPLYAVARALLIRILGGTDLPQRPELDDVCGPSESLRLQNLAEMSLAATAGGNPFTSGTLSGASILQSGAISYNPAGRGHHGMSSANSAVGTSTPPLMRDMSMNFNRIAQQQQQQTGHGNGHNHNPPPPNPRDVTRANSIAGIPHAVSSGNIDSTSYNGHHFAKLPASAASAAAPAATANQTAGNAGGEFSTNNKRLNQQFSPTSYPTQGNNKHSFTAVNTANNSDARRHQHQSPEVIDVTLSSSSSPIGTTRYLQNNDDDGTNTTGSTTSAASAKHISFSSPLPPAATAEVGGDTYAEDDEDAVGGNNNPNSNKNTSKVSDMDLDLITASTDTSGDEEDDGEAEEDGDEYDEEGDTFAEGLEDEDVDGYKDTTALPSASSFTAALRMQPNANGGGAPNSSSSNAMLMMGGSGVGVDGNPSFTSPITTDHTATPTPTSATTSAAKAAKKKKVSGEGATATAKKSTTAATTPKKPKKSSAASPIAISLSDIEGSGSSPSPRQGAATSVPTATSASSTSRAASTSTPLRKKKGASSSVAEKGGSSQK